MTIPGGYLLKPRCIQQSWIAHAAPVVRETWDWLLLNANYKDVKYDSYIVLRGQLFCTYLDIRKGLFWTVGYRKQMYSESQMKHGMKLLMNQRMVALAKRPRGNLITICNYGYYQDPENYESTNERPINRPTNDPSIDQASLSISKESKEVKKEESKTPSSDEKEIFDFWVIAMDKSKQTKFSAKRKSKVSARLNDKYTVDQIKTAITGCKNSAYHQGDNQNGMVYDDLELICRSPEKLDSFIQRSKTVDYTSQSNAQAAEEFINDVGDDNGSGNIYNQYDDYVKLENGDDHG